MKQVRIFGYQDHPFHLKRKLRKFRRQKIFLMQATECANKKRKLPEKRKRRKKNKEIVENGHYF
jgi:hypothetical protein